MLGLGLMTVYGGRGRKARVEVACEPGPVHAPGQPQAARPPVKEFADRSGDFNVGGSTRRPLVTAYREETLRVAHFLNVNGPSRVRDVEAAGASERAGAILQRNYYGWFLRISRGVYDLTPAGEEGSRALSRRRRFVRTHGRDDLLQQPVDAGVDELVGLLEIAGVIRIGHIHAPVCQEYNRSTGGSVPGGPPYRRGFARWRRPSRRCSRRS